MKAKHSKAPAERVVKDIRRATRKQYSAEEKIRIVLEGLRGEDSIAELCRKEGIAQGVYYKWSKDFMEAGKRRLAGDTARAAFFAFAASLGLICFFAILALRVFCAGLLVLSSNLPRRALCACQFTPFAPNPRGCNTGCAFGLLPILF